MDTRGGGTASSVRNHSASASSMVLMASIVSFIHFSISATQSVRPSFSPAPRLRITTPSDLRALSRFLRPSLVGALPFQHGSSFAHSRRVLSSSSLCQRRVLTPLCSLLKESSNDIELKNL